MSSNEVSFTKVPFMAASHACNHSGMQPTLDFSLFGETHQRLHTSFMQAFPTSCCKFYSERNTRRLDGEAKQSFYFTRVLRSGSPVSMDHTCLLCPRPPISPVYKLQQILRSLPLSLSLCLSSEFHSHISYHDK